MRLLVKLLARNASVNQYSYVPTVKMERGERVDLFFQLFDADSGVRFIPASGATVSFDIPRMTEIVPNVLNTSDVNDWTISKPASVAFVGDSSIYKVTLLQTETVNMISSNVRITVTEGTTVSIANVKQAIQVQAEVE